MAEMLTITNPMANCSVGLMEKSGEASRGVQEFDEAGQEVDSIAMNCHELYRRKIRRNWIMI